MADIWFDRLGEALKREGLATYSPPLQADAAQIANIQTRIFGPYDAGGGNWQFNTGLRFDVPTGSSARYLYAMTTGSLVYHPGAGGAPGRIILIRGDVFSSAIAQASGALPRWFPQPRFVVYDNVDQNDAREAALAALSREGAIDGTLNRANKARAGRGEPKLKADKIQLADMWIREEIPSGIPVLGGDLVGGCGASAVAGRLISEVRMVERIDPSPIRFFNPSYYIALWDALDWLVKDDLLATLVNISAPPLATGHMLYVKKTGASNTPPFDSPAKASTTIKDAVSAAATGDTILILDQETYQEQITIDKPIALTSVGTSTAISGSLDFPKLDGNSSFRPLLIQKVNQDVVFVSKLVIRNGQSTASGGGISIEESNNTVISSCVIQQCKAKAWGGGIFVHHASPAIVGCLIQNNQSQDRGGGIMVHGYGWPAIFDCLIKNNTLPGGISSLPDGGGIAITISLPKFEDPFSFLAQNPTKANLKNFFDSTNLKRARQNYVRIIRCSIQNNTADDDGGGVYISVASKVIMHDTKVESNKAGLDGGGIRVTMESELRLRNCKILKNESNHKKDSSNDMRAGGGGISCRNSRLIKLEQTMVDGNIANGWAGGGVYFLSTDEGSFEDPTGGASQLDFDWNDFLLDVFGHISAILEIDAASDIRANQATFISGQSSDHGKGGGLYVLRWKGSRHSKLGPLIATPISITIDDVGTLKASNTGSFVNANRLYLEDQATSLSPKIKDDTSLPAGGRFRYP